MTVRVGNSPGECLGALIPSNPRARRVLQLSDLYRGFEFLSLRHAVWDAEKSCPLSANIDVAEKAIHQRLRGLPIANSREHRELRDALNSLAVLKRML